MFLNNNSLLRLSFSPASEDVFENIETGSSELLTDGEKIAIGRAVDEWVALGLWSEIYSFIPLSGLLTSGRARVDWKTGVQATLVNAPTYDPTTGFTTNGTDNYINTQVNPSTINGGGAIPLDDAAYSIHCIDNIAACRMGVVGTVASGQAFIFVTNAGVATFRHHRSNSGTETDALQLGLDDDFYTITRSSTTVILCKDGQRQTVFVGTAGSSVPTGRTIFVGALNSNGTTNNYGQASYGTFMINKHTTFDRVKFFVHWELLMQELNVKTRSVLYPLELNGTTNPDSAIILNSEGQSNGMFCGNADPPLALPAELSAPIVGANVFWREVDLSDPTVDIETLEYTVNNTYSSIGLLDNYGAGLRAAYEIVRRQNSQLYIWHYCKSGTGLTAEAVDDWYPDLVGKLYHNSHTSIASQGIPMISQPIDRLIWHWSQGETDAANAYARTQAEYTADFYYFLNKKIITLEGFGIDFDVTKFHVMVAMIYSGLPPALYATPAEVRAAQAALSVEDFETAYPTHAGKVRSFVVYDNDKLIHTDLVHIDSEGVMIEGYRLGMYISRIED